MNIFKKLLFAWTMTFCGASYSMEIGKTIVNSLVNEETAKIFALTAGSIFVYNVASTIILKKTQEEADTIRKANVFNLIKSSVKEGAILALITRLHTGLGCQWPQLTTQDLIKPGIWFFGVTTALPLLIGGLTYASYPILNDFVQKKYKQQLPFERKKLSIDAGKIMYGTCYIIGLSVIEISSFIKRYKMS